jgi:hypothetical protein
LIRGRHGARHAGARIAARADARIRSVCAIGGAARARREQGSNDGNADNPMYGHHGLPLVSDIGNTIDGAFAIANLRDAWSCSARIVT